MQFAADAFAFLHQVQPPQLVSRPPVLDGNRGLGGEQLDDLAVRGAQRGPARSVGDPEHAQAPAFGHHRNRDRELAFRIQAADVGGVLHILAVHGGGVQLAGHSVGDGQHCERRIDQLPGSARDQLQHRLGAAARQEGLGDLGDGRRAVVGPFALGGVAGDLGEAAETATGVAEGSDHDLGPEAAAVLAQAPAFGLEATLVGGHSEGALGQAPADVLGRIEDRYRLAQDLLGGIALDALGTRVPARHPAGRIDHEDGVVLDSVEQ